MARELRSAIEPSKCNSVLVPVPAFKVVITIIHVVMEGQETTQLESHLSWDLEPECRIRFSLVFGTLDTVTNGLA